MATTRPQRARRRARLLSLAPLACALALLAAPARADVIVLVDNGIGAPPGDANTFADAVALAADGDVIYVHPGDYSALQTPAFVDDLALTVVAGGPNVILPPLVITNLSAGKEFVLRGVEINAFFPLGGQTQPRVELVDCAGRVWLEDCELVGLSGNVSAGKENGLPALRAVRSGEIVLARCELTGGSGASVNPAFSPDAGHGAPAVEAVDSSLQIHDGSLRGGHGGSNLVSPLAQQIGDGAPAILAERSLLLVGGNLGFGGGLGLGGDGGDALQGVVPGSGGAGAELIDSHARRNGMLLAAGQPGSNEFGPPLPPTPDILLTSSTFVEGAGLSRTVRVPAPVISGEAGEIVYRGLQGDRYLLFAALDGLVLQMPARNGVWMLAPPLIPLGGVKLVTALEGTDVTPFVAADLSAFGLDSLVLRLQAFAVDVQDFVHVSSAGTLVQLDVAP